MRYIPREERIAYHSDYIMYIEKNVHNRETALKALDTSEKFVDKSKFSVISYFKIKDFENPIEINLDSKICVVYCIWRDVRYLKLLHLSLKSLVRFTDLKDINLRILVDDRLYKLAINLFDGVLPSKCIINVNKPLIFKYNVPLIPELQYFSHIIVWDADAIAYDWSGKRHSFFKDIISKHEEGSIILFKKLGRFNNSFEIMNKNLNKTDPYWFFKNECGINNIYEIDDKYEMWHNSSFAMYKRNDLKSVMYKNIVSSSLFNFHKCDETVYHVYAFVTDREIVTLDDLGYNTVTFSNFNKWYNDKESGFTYLHWVQGLDISPIIPSTIKLYNDLNESK